MGKEEKIAARLGGHREPAKRIAKKDHIVHANEHHFEIKKGDDLSAKKFEGLLENFETTLKTEKVL